MEPNERIKNRNDVVNKFDKKIVPIRYLSCEHTSKRRTAHTHTYIEKEERFGQYIPCKIFDALRC